jgi:DNA-binding MarR family transcriptional regulator
MDGLEADGLAARGRHPTDRRASLVSLTDRGTEIMAGLADEYQAGSSFLLAGVAPQDLAAFVHVACVVMDRIRAAKR